MFDNALILVPLSTGIIFIIAGFIMLKFPPKEINSLYGYHTTSSMKSKERWIFAQHYSSKKMIITGVLLACSSSLGTVFDFGQNINTILGLSLMFMSIIVLIWRVETAIATKFNYK